MMFLNSARPVAAALIVAVAGAAGWWTLSTRAETVVPQPAKTVPVVGGTALDLTTPEKSLESFCRALQAGDADSAYAATTAVPSAIPTDASAFMSLNLEQNRLILAAAKAFDSDGQEARRFVTLDVILLKLLAYNRIHNKAAVVSGDTATIPFDLTGTALEQASLTVRKQVAAFADHPLRFVKQGNDWKLNPSSDIVITLLDKGDRLVEDPSLKIKVVQEYADAFKKCAAEVENGSYVTWAEAERRLKADIEKLHTDHNLSDIEVEIVPKK